MVMVEYLTNAAACPLGNFACALGGADADILAGDRCTLADIASSVEWVKCDKVARTFPNTLGRCASALSSSFANVSGASTHVATRAALPGLRRDRRLRCLGGLLRGLGLAVLTAGVLATDGKRECQQRDRRFLECGSH